jgi:uncharacterized protein YbjT (DUF2867 family)
MKIVIIGGTGLIGTAVSAHSKNLPLFHSINILVNGRSLLCWRWPA